MGPFFTPRSRSRLWADQAKRFWPVDFGLGNKGCEIFLTEIRFFLLRLPVRLRKYRLTEADGTRKRGSEATEAKRKR